MLCILAALAGQSAPVLGQQLFRNEGKLRPGSVQAGLVYSYTQFNVRSARTGQQDLYDLYQPGSSASTQYQLPQPPTFSQYSEELGQGGGFLEAGMQWYYEPWNLGLGPRLALGSQSRKSTYRYAYTDTSHTGTDTNMFMKVKNLESYMQLQAGAELSMVTPALIRRLSLTASMSLSQQVQFLRSWQQEAERTVSYRDSVSRVFRDTITNRSNTGALLYPEWRITLGLVYHLSRSTSVWVRLSNRAPLLNTGAGVPVSSQELGAGFIFYLPNQTLSYYRREY